MSIRPQRIFPLSDNAVTVEFGDSISEEFNDTAIALADHFTQAPFAGCIESVPAIVSTTIFYDPLVVRKTAPHRNAYSTVHSFIESALQHLTAGALGQCRSMIFPVRFGPEYALDLDALADSRGLSPDTVIEIFLSIEYRVYMLGFLPGFAYMGQVDERIAAPRRATPRTHVPKGGVGIAGRQTGIYPTASPGGWQIIGNTPLELITANDKAPCLFSAGDRVRFVRSDK